MKVIKISAMWCSSCVIMNTVFNKLKKAYPNIEFLEYDYDMDEGVVKTYNPGEILPVIIFEEKDEVERIKGEHSFKEIEDIIKRYYHEEIN